MRKTIVALLAVVSLLALVPTTAAAASRNFVGFSGYSYDGDITLTGVPTATCTAKYCARLKPGKKDRSITVSVMNVDDVTAEQLFSVGQDRNGDGDAIDSGEYGLACGSGSFRIKPRKAVDIQILFGVWENGSSICISTPTYGTLTYGFSR